MYYWIDLVAMAAAGGVGGFIYWSVAERERILGRVKALLRQR